MVVEESKNKELFTTFLNLECGVLVDKDEKFYSDYATVYDKKHGYYDETYLNAVAGDEEKVKIMGLNYVKNGVNGTYAILTSIDIQGTKEDDYIQDAIKEIEEQNFIDDSVGFFDGEQYKASNVIWSAYKDENGEIHENFIEGQVTESLTENSEKILGYTKSDLLNKSINELEDIKVNIVNEREGLPEMSEKGLQLDDLLLWVEDAIAKKPICHNCGAELGVEKYTNPKNGDVLCADCYAELEDEDVEESLKESKEFPSIDEYKERLSKIKSYKELKDYIEEYSDELYLDSNGKDSLEVWYDIDGEKDVLMIFDQFFDDWHKENYDESLKEDKSFKNLTIEEMFFEVAGKKFKVFDKNGHFTKEAWKLYGKVAERFGDYDKFDALCGEEGCFEDDEDIQYYANESLEESKEDKLETFEDKMNFLAKDEQEAIDGYDKIIALLDPEKDKIVIEQLNKIKTEEIAHKAYAEEVINNHDLVYTEPLDNLEESLGLGYSYREVSEEEKKDLTKLIGKTVLRKISDNPAGERGIVTNIEKDNYGDDRVIVDKVFSLYPDEILVIDFDIKEGAEGHRVPGMEYVIYEIDDKAKKAPIVAIRKTYTEAQYFCNKEENFTRELGIEEVPEGRFKKGDDFWGPFDGDWNLVEASSAEKKAYKDGGQRFADYIQGKAIARIKDPEARDAAVALAKAGNSKVDRFVGDRKVDQAERSFEKKADKMQKAGVEEAKEGKHVEYIEMPHEVYDTPEEIKRINDELDAKAKAGKLIGIRKEPKMLQLAEPEINGIWTIYLNDKGFIEKIVVF